MTNSSTSASNTESTEGLLQDAREILASAEKRLLELLAGKGRDHDWKGVPEILSLARSLDRLRRAPASEIGDGWTIARSTSAGGDHSADHGDGGEGMLPGWRPSTVGRLLAAARRHHVELAFVFPPGRRGPNPAHSRPSGLKSDGDNTADDGGTGRGGPGGSRGEPQQKPDEGIEGG